MKRVAVGGLHTECSSYNPLEQTIVDFTRCDGDELVELVKFDFARAGIDLIPLFHDRSVPGGPVSVETWTAQTELFFDMLRAALPLDGVLLIMHGAVFVPGVTDPEGDFIAEVRKIVGPEAILSGSFDLHGQITQQIVDTLDAFAAYRTAPHVDVAETHTRAASLLADALNGGPRPMVVREAIPILAPGEMSSTFVAPCDALYAQLPEIDTRDRVLDSNLMIGYVWADSPRATASAVVTATNATAGANAARDIAESYHAACDDLAFDVEVAQLADALSRTSGTASILADSGDNPTAGGVGDRADVLESVFATSRTGVLFAGIADPTAFKALAKGATTVTLGGSLGGGGPRVPVFVEKCETIGECAVVQSRGVTVVVTEIRRPFHDLSNFETLGLAIDDFDLLVVKSGYLSTDLRSLPRRQIMALTDGAVSQDLSRLENKHRPDGTWPFSTY